jgi:2-iminobutanoate/2-iminopropanoate deaminase
MTTTYGPYTPVRRAGNLLFISGQVGINTETRVAPADIETQTQQALDNMASVLQSVGANLQDVIKTTVFLTAMDDMVTMNTVYERVFSLPRPARSTVEVRALPHVTGMVPLLIEIEAVAYQEAV